MTRIVFFVFLSLWAAPAAASPLQDLDPIGEATLKVFLWTIYDSALYSPAGEYRGIEPDLALAIDYRRNISTEQLLDATREQWQELNLLTPGHEAWIQSLARLWPDISKGDQLVLRVDDKLGSEFFLNGEPLGLIADRKFTEDFLAIFIGENSSYPRLRDRLVGLR